ncbi:MAG: Ig-like domain-containing protein [Planctomycetia bacterium]|jgi:hypothetical protein
MKSLLSIWSRKTVAKSKKSRAQGCRLAAESLETRAVFSATALAPDLDAASDTGWSAIDNRTADTTPTFTIQAPGATAVTLFTVAGRRVTEVGTATQDGSAWTATLGPLPNGKYSIAARAFVDDVAGKLSRPLAIEINTTTPAVPTIGLDATSDSGFKGDRITNLPSPLLSGRGQRGTTVVLTSPSVAGGAEQRVAVNGKGVWAYRATGLADGPHSFTVKAQSVFGGQSATATLTMTVDTVRPTAVGMRYVADVNEIELEFSDPVRGVDVKDFRISAPGFGIRDVPLTDRRIVATVGRITVHDVSAGRVYRLRMSTPDVIGGTFTIRLAAAKSGIIDNVSGNPLLVDNAVSVTF